MNAWRPKLNERFWYLFIRVSNERQSILVDSWWGFGDERHNTFRTKRDAEEAARKIRKILGIAK